MSESSSRSLVTTPTPASSATSTRRPVNMGLHVSPGAMTHVGHGGGTVHGHSGVLPCLMVATIVTIVTLMVSTFAGISANLTAQLHFHSISLARHCEQIVICLHFT